MVSKFVKLAKSYRRSKPSVGLFTSLFVLLFVSQYYYYYYYYSVLYLVTGDLPVVVRGARNFAGNDRPPRPR